MSVTIYNTGNNSRQLVIKDEYHPALANGIIDKLTTAITQLGWTLFDTVTSGTNNCLVTKVFTAVCNDGGSPSTKYMILRFDAPRQYFYMSCCESWNDTTHVATNECFTQYNGFPFPLQTGNYIIHVFATQRYCVIQPVLRGEPGIWQGIFEFERVAPDTASGAPCFGYTNAVIIGSPFYSTTANTFGGSIGIDSATSPRNHNMPVWVPRLSSGETGLAAAKLVTLTIGGQSFPPRLSGFLFNSNSHIAISNSTYSHLGQGIASIAGPNINYRANTLPRTILSPKFSITANNAVSGGRFYGMNISPNIGEMLDVTYIPINSNGFFSNSGSVSKHYVLGMTGGNDSSIANGAGRLKFDFIDHDPTSNAAVFYDAVVVRGRYIYLTCGNTTAGYSILKKYDLDLNKWQEISLPGVGDSLIYDGGNNLYVSTSLGITRFNVDNTAIVANLSLSASLPGGAAAMGICETYVYAMQRNLSLTNNNLAIVNSSFAAERYVTGISTGNTSGANSRYSIVFAPNYSFPVITLINSSLSEGATPATNLTNYRISGSNGAFLSNVVLNYTTGFSSTSGNSCTSVSYFYNTDYIVLKYNGSSTSGTSTGATAGFQAVIRTSNLQVIATNNMTANTTAPYRESGDQATGFAGVPPFKMREAIPFKGYRLSNGHRGGASLQAYDNLFKTFYDHASESFISNHTFSNSFACTFPHIAGCAFTDGVFYYRFNTNSANNISKVYGQMQTKNNLGNTTPVLLIRA
jgi:hypothetical protein